MGLHDYSDVHENRSVTLVPHANSAVTYKGAVRVLLSEMFASPLCAEQNSNIYN